MIGWRSVILVKSCPLFAGKNSPLSRNISSIEGAGGHFPERIQMKKNLMLNSGLTDSSRAGSSSPFFSFGVGRPDSVNGAIVGAAEPQPMERG